MNREACYRCSIPYSDIDLRRDDVGHICVFCLKVDKKPAPSLSALPRGVMLYYTAGAQSTPVKDTGAKKIYICTPLADAKFPIEKIENTILKHNVFAFIPPSTQLLNKKLGSQTDKHMIDGCDELWVFGPIGRDCAWEIGYAQGLGKKVVFHKDDSNEHVLKSDWMVMLGDFEIVEE